MQDARDQAAPEEKHHDDEGGQFAERDGKRTADRIDIDRVNLIGSEILQHTGERRQQHQHQHGDDVLHHQPADGEAAAIGFQHAPFL